MTGKEQARLLGLFFWLLTGVQLLLVALFGLLYAGIFGVVLVSAPHKADEPPPELFAGIIVIVMIFVFATTLLFSIPKLVAGYGLRKEKSWAKIWAVIASIMACMAGPLGIAVGVYGLVFIFGDAGKAYFDNPSFGQVPNNNFTPPPPNSWQQ